MATWNIQLRHFRSPFNDRLLRVFTALMAAHLVLVLSSEFGFFEILLTSSYRRFMPGSIGMALFVVQAISCISSLLYHHCPYSIYPQKRLLWQLLLGLGLVNLLSYLGAKFFYAYHGLQMAQTSYMGTIYPAVFVFMLLLNAYYLGYDHFLHRIGQLEQHQHLARLPIMKHAGFDLRQLPLASLGLVANTPVLIFTQCKMLKVYHLDQHAEMFDQTLPAFYAQLPASDYFMISKCCIVHRVLIFKLKHISSQRYGLLLRQPFYQLCGAKPLEVSRGKTIQFRQWYQL